MGDGGLQPLLSIHDIDGFQKRQEQEAILALRKRAIARWLRQLPLPDESRKRRTMWTSFQSFGDLDDSVRAMPHGRSCDIESNIEEASEETPLDSLEKKSPPSDNECPIRSLNSVKGDGHDRFCSASPSEVDVCCSPKGSSDRRHARQFSEKWTSETSSPVVSDRAVPEIQERPLKSIRDALRHQTSGTYETSGSDGGWGAVSDDIDVPSQNEDTAYGGSAYGSHKNKCEGLFHVKYRVSSPVFSPPASQSIEPRSPTDTKHFTQRDLKSNLDMSRNKIPEGEWWMPNIFFKGLVDMVCQTGLQTEETASQSSIVDAPDASAMSDRVLQRLSRRRRFTRRCSVPRLPSLYRLRLRMQQARRLQNAREIQCRLEHPCVMKSMVPDATQTPNPLAPPEIRVMDYLPPPSVADLSDFDCYMGPVLSAFVPQRPTEHPDVGHCQTWMLEKLLCFLGGRTRHL